MAFQADSITWRSLLIICKIHESVEIGKKAIYSILQLDPQNSIKIFILVLGCGGRFKS